MRVRSDESIPPLSRAQFRAARRLLSRRGRQDAGEFLAEGAQAVREALATPGTVRALIVDDPAQHEELVAMAAPDSCWRAEGRDIEQLSDTVTPQGVVAVCRRIDVPLDALGEPRLVVIAAQMRDPGNAGTVIRCADAFGADAVLLTKGSVDPHNPKTVRASVGSVFHLPVVTDVGLEEAVSWAREHGCQVLAAAGGGDSLDEMARSGRLDRPTAWIMGNEAWGIPDDERRLADRVVGVPMWGRAESLNLATATAVCLYATACEQRRGDRSTQA